MVMVKKVKAKMKRRVSKAPAKKAAKPKRAVSRASSAPPASALGEALADARRLVSQLRGLVILLGNERKELALNWAEAVGSQPGSNGSGPDHASGTAGDQGGRQYSIVQAHDGRESPMSPGGVLAAISEVLGEFSIWNTGMRPTRPRRLAVAVGAIEMIATSPPPADKGVEYLQWGRDHRLQVKDGPRLELVEDETLAGCSVILYGEREEEVDGTHGQATVDPA
jgi:hypothetical protein